MVPEQVMRAWARAWIQECERREAAMKRPSQVMWLDAQLRKAHAPVSALRVVPLFPRPGLLLPK